MRPLATSLLVAHLSQPLIHAPLLTHHLHYAFCG